MATFWRTTLAGALLGLAVLTLGPLGCRKTPVDLPVTWETDVDASVAKARRAQKPVLVYFGASWDSAAKELEHSTFTDPEVRFLLRRDFVSVRVDATDEEDPTVQKNQNRFKVVGDPTLVILGADGATEVARITEYVRPEVFATILRRAMRPDAVREARFEAEARARDRARAEDQRWAEQRRWANLPPTTVIVLDPADAQP